jgi:hypothetical protein
MELTLSIIGLLLSVAIAVWEHRRANKAEALLKKTLVELPRRLISDISRLVAPPDPDKNETESDASGLHVRYADLNGDGRDELLISHLSGAHNTTLQVYGMKSFYEFGLIDELSSSVPTEFDLEDVDGDGAPEIVIFEIARRPDLPYAMGLSDRVTYKLTPDGFKEIARVECFTDEELQQVLRKNKGA